MLLIYYKLQPLDCYNHVLRRKDYVLEYNQVPVSLTLAMLILCNNASTLTTKYANNLSTTCLD